MSSQFEQPDPVTGQAAWFDVRVGLRKCAAEEAGTWPTFAALPSSGPITTVIVPPVRPGTVLVVVPFVSPL